MYTCSCVHTYAHKHMYTYALNYMHVHIVHTHTFMQARIDLNIQPLYSFLFLKVYLL